MKITGQQDMCGLFISPILTASWHPASTLYNPSQNCAHLTQTLHGQAVTGKVNAGLFLELVDEHV
jgi:hypothetical protein